MGAGLLLLQRDDESAYLETLLSERFKIGNDHFTVTVAQPYEFSSSADDRSIEIYWPGRNHRTPQFLSLSVPGDSAPGTAWSKKNLANDVTMAYSIASSEGGSGGDEIELSGRVTTPNGSALDVKCRHQSELSPSVDFCFDILKTLRPASAE